MKPLTAEQSQIAELNHDLVFEFLNEYNLPESQYYDVVIFGYLCAVQEYCEKPELQKYLFSTVAWRQMKHELYRHYKYHERKKRDFQTVSLSDIKRGDDASLKTDETAAENKLLEDLNFSLLLHSLASAITEKQMRIIRMKLAGFRMHDIARTEKMTFKDINRALNDTYVIIETLL